MAKYILKITQTFGSKTLVPDAVTYHSDWSKVLTKEKVSYSLDCLWMLVMKHFNKRLTEGHFRASESDSKNLVIIDFICTV